MALVADACDDYLAAALAERVQTFEGQIVVVAPDSELEWIGDCARIAAYRCTDSKTAGRKFLSQLVVSRKLRALPVPFTLPFPEPQSS